MRPRADWTWTGRGRVDRAGTRTVLVLKTNCAHKLIKITALRIRKDQDINELPVSLIASHAVDYIEYNSRRQRFTLPASLTF